MEKNQDTTQEAIFQSVYETKGLLNLVRGDLAHYFKQIGYLLGAILVTLILICYKMWQ